MTRRNDYPVAEVPAVQTGKAKPIWRSLDDKGRAPEERARLADTEAHDGSFLSAESLTRGRSSQDAAPKGTDIGRRGFLAASTVTAAAGLLEGCIRRPEEHILPYGEAPEHVVPGVPLHFATVTERLGDAMGLLVTSHEGRPTKVEGNPNHPSTGQGAADVWSQASLMDLYDPDRSTTPARSEGGTLVDEAWTAAEVALRERLDSHQGDGGAGLVVLAPPNSSPSFRRARGRFLDKFPQASFHTWGSVTDANMREGARIAFGRPLNVHHDFRGSRVILSIDSDFMMTEPNALTNSWRFALGRPALRPTDPMNRLYVVEPGHSLTGSNADHRLRLPSSQIARYLKVLAKRLAVESDVDLADVASAVSDVNADGIPEAWIEKVAAELLANRRHAVIVAGLRQPPAVHALVHAINRALGNDGATVIFTGVADDGGGPVGAVPPVPPAPPGAATAPAEAYYNTQVSELAAAMTGARTMLILGSNPVYDAPADIGFAEKLGSIDFSLHVGSHRDETAAASKWHVPMAHELESWGDLRSRDGTYAVQQPLIAPLHGGRSTLEILGFAAGDEDPKGHSQVQSTFSEVFARGTSSSEAWRTALHAGVLAGSTRRPEPPQPLDTVAIALAVRGMAEVPMPTSDALEVAFVPCSKMLDGGRANNVWLQELPDNMSKLVWDNAALVSPATATQLGLSDRDVIRLEADGSPAVEAAVHILPGVADNVVVAPLGWGRHAAGRYGNGQGFDFGPLRTTEALWHRSGVRVTRTGDDWFLARTQEHGTMHGRPIAIDGTLEEYQETPDFPQYRAVEMDIPPLWDTVDYDGQYKWGMSIDLTACTGCNACVIACQAENNIPSVGKGMVARGREMYWIRLDRYFVGEDVNEPQVAFQPIGCQQCEEAPCENVCPVNATAHSPEGLNDMAYNRCIGTRYCANNCPYKVRRFNYLNYHEYLEDPNNARSMDVNIPATRQMSYNPNVTVRMRGVMEKCSYCVQRLQEAKIASRRDDRPIAEGTVRAACQETCPTKAIVFGCLNGYPYVVRKGSALVGKTADEIARDYGLREVRIERETVVPDSEHRVAVQEVDSIEENDAFLTGQIKYTVYSASRLPQLQSHDRHYKLLVELGVRPRTTFLGRIRNPNSEMV
ncbi:MAG: 4Fe-4S dicluster domain-containing protein [Deltaproteobacteria bacterium]|nr:4Fe-4S dicluster domain-containing protein [Deltaproteobacteria bacterium]